MKKLFTFLMAMVVVAMCFAQNGKYEVVGVPADQGVDRSDWIGWYAQSGYVHTQVAESEYFLYLPAGTFTSQVTLEKVRFYTIPSENINNYTGDEFTLDNDFVIRIYTGASVNGVDFNPGTIAYSQSYNPATAGAEAGPQNITLTTPFVAGPNDNIAIGIYSAGLSSMGLCDDDPECAAVNFALWPEYDEGIHHYYWTGGNPAWAYENATVREHDPWNLSVYYNDGVGYQPKSDWHTEIYDPEDEAQYPDGITWLYIDEFTDTLYFYGGCFNLGLDSAYGLIYRSIYALNEGSTEPIYFLEPTQFNATENVPEGVDVNYGWRVGPVALLGVADFADAMLTYPFQLCFEVEYETDPSYHGYDPNPDNNVYCITVSDEPQPDPDGIAENANTLKVTPNPASTTLTVENAAGAQIYVYNIAGQEVMSVESAEANETLNVSNLNAGLYIVRVVNGNEVSTAKVSIVR